MEDISYVQENVEKAALLLKSLSNEKRLHIICSIYDGEKNVGELEKIVGLSQSALSQHLGRLRRDGIVKTRRDAQTIYYSIKSDEAHYIIKALRDIYCKDQQPH